MKNCKIMLILILITGCCFSAYQDAPKIKSITVLAERGDVLIKKQLKESEACNICESYVLNDCEDDE